MKFLKILSVLVGVLMLVACGSGGSTSVGELRDAASAQATQAAVDAANLQARAATELPTYCDANPDRCIAIGDADAPVTLYEVSDYGCPACKALAENVVPQLQSTYVDGGQLRIVKLPTAILTTQAGTLQTPLSPQAVMCAQEQGAGSAYHDALFADQVAGADRSSAEFVALATELGLDAAGFGGCLDSERYESASAETRNLAVELGVNSTPTLFINGVTVTGANLPPILDAIEEELGN